MIKKMIMILLLCSVFMQTNTAFAAECNPETKGRPEVEYKPVKEDCFEKLDAKKQPGKKHTLKVAAKIIAVLAILYISYEIITNAIGKGNDYTLLKQIIDHFLPKFSPKGLKIVNADGTTIETHLFDDTFKQVYSNLGQASIDSLLVGATVAEGTVGESKKTIGKKQFIASALVSAIDPLKKMNTFCFTAKIVSKLTETTTTTTHVPEGAHIELILDQ